MTAASCFRVLFLAVALSLLAGPAAAFVCQECRREIVSDAIMAAPGIFYHEACFRCAVCQYPILDLTYVPFQGRNYHPNCYRIHFLPRCAICGRLIDGTFITLEGKDYHPACTPPCIVCNQPIEDGAKVINPYGEEYYLHHRCVNRSLCFFCRRQICPALTGGGTTIADGRRVCNLCRQSAVDDPARARQIFLKVRATLDRNPVFNLDRRGVKQVTFSLVDLPAFTRTAGLDYLPTLRGLTKTTWLTRDDKSYLSGNYSIYALTGTPEIMLRSIIAHELMHVWFHQTLAREPAQPVVEGACNFVGWYYVKHKCPTTKAAADVITGLFSDTSPIYGDGFRQLHGQFAAKSLSSLLHHLAPPGSQPPEFDTDPAADTGLELGRFVGNLNPGKLFLLVCTLGVGVRFVIDIRAYRSRRNSS